MIHDPNEMWIRILFNLKACLDVMCPVRKLVSPEYTPEWLTPPIIDAMRIRDDLYRVARTNYNDDTCSWNIANFHRNRVESLIFNSRKTEVGFLLAYRKDDPAKFWEGIRKLLPNKTMSTLIKLRNNATGLLLPQDECSQFVNDFFANIGKNLTDALPVLPPVWKPRTNHTVSRSQTQTCLNRLVIWIL